MTGKEHHYGFLLEVVVEANTLEEAQKEIEHLTNNIKMNTYVVEAKVSEGPEELV